MLKRPKYVDCENMLIYAMSLFVTAFEIAKNVSLSTKSVLLYFDMKVFSIKAMPSARFLKKNVSF